MTDDVGYACMHSITSENVLKDVGMQVSTKRRCRDICSLLHAIPVLPA